MADRVTQVVTVVGEVERRVIAAAERERIKRAMALSPAWGRVPADDRRAIRAIIDGRESEHV